MKLLSSETAASEVIGHILILFITILGVGMIALYGVPAIYSLEDMANSKNSEQAFTVLDSRASRVTLGESPLQVTNINLGGGTLTVEPNSTTNPSYMVVSSSSFNVTIPMGRVKYTLGDRIVAYEGGGIWAQYPGGGTVMLSPPEIHFNGWTLTLPVININGNSSVGGKGTAVVSFKKNATLIQYPNTSRPDWINRTNPVNTAAGKVYVNVTSDFYKAWTEYGSSLGYTKVSKNDTTHTTSIELTVVPSTLGSSTSITTDSLTFRGLNASDQTPLDNFSFKLYSDNLKWDIRAQAGNKTLIFYIFHGALTIGYSDSNYSGLGETWGTYTYHEQEDAKGDYIQVDLLNRSITLDYSNQNAIGAKSSCTPAGKIDGAVNPAYSWNNPIIRTDNSNKTQSLYNITQHYFWIMAQEGTISFSQCYPSGQAPDPGSSTVLVDYEPTGALTYLHITENRADVGIS